MMPRIKVIERTVLVAKKVHKALESWALDEKTGATFLWTISSFRLHNVLNSLPGNLASPSPLSVPQIYITLANRALMGTRKCSSNIFSGHLPSKDILNKCPISDLAIVQPLLLIAHADSA
jgi:hypothetical protein